MCLKFLKSSRNITCLLLFVCCGLLYSYFFYFSNGNTTVEEVPETDMNQTDENKRRESLDVGTEEKKPESSEKTYGDGVDLVYNWMNGSDPQFRENLQAYLNSINRKDAQLFALNRYHDFGTLKYSLRSVQQYANWFRHIFIVTNGQAPYWLNLDNPRITLVTHEELFPDRSDLPTFSFQAVESHLFRIKGLSKRFVCMYDDIILTSEILLEDFVSQYGQFQVHFYSWGLQGCSKSCLVEDVNNGKCERHCYTKSCEWDGDDCKGKNIIPDLEKNDDVMFDSWKGSIIHTQFLFNKEFGPRSREVPSSGPHMYDKDIFKLLHDRFQDEWAKTSSYKIRHDQSINIQFAYYNFLFEASILGLYNMSFSAIELTEGSEIIILTIGNKEYLERIQQLESTKNDILLKKPKFLITANKFTVYDGNIERLKEIENDIEKTLFKKLFPKPSVFEL